MALERPSMEPRASLRRAGARLVFVFLAAALGVLMAACLPQSTPLPPLPTDTPAPPTTTPTATTVWFPATATYTPFPTPVITPTQDLNMAAGALLFEDDFSDPAPWALSRSSTASAALGVDELTLALHPPADYVYTLRSEPLLGDFYLEVTASPSICRGEDEYGLLLRVSPAVEFYRFGLSCSGEARLDKFFNGAASSPQPLAPSGAVPPGAPSRSRLSVWAQGRVMRFFVNGEFQFEVSDPSLASGTIGFFVRAASHEAVTVSFSDLAVYTPGGP